MPLRRAALVPILLLALIAYLNAMCPDASGEGDPHLTFAHGGKADFRDEHGRLFNLLSAARLSINAMTEEGIFRMNEATVNGSWLTQVPRRRHHGGWPAPVFHVQLQDFACEPFGLVKRHLRR